MSQYWRVNVPHCQLFPRRCVALDRPQNVYPLVPAISYALPPRAQTHSYAWLPPVPWRAEEGRDHRDDILKKRFGKMAGVPPCINAVVATVTLEANLDGLLMDLQPIFIVGLLSYRPGKQEGGGRIAGEASRPRPPPPRRPPPRPDLQLSWRAAVACLSPRRPDRGGWRLLGQRCAHPLVAAYTPAGVCTPISNGEVPGDGAVER